MKTHLKSIAIYVHPGMYFYIRLPFHPWLELILLFFHLKNLESYEHIPLKLSVLHAQKQYCGRFLPFLKFCHSWASPLFVYIEECELSDESPFHHADNEGNNKWLSIFIEFFHISPHN